MIVKPLLKVVGLAALLMLTAVSVIAQDDPPPVDREFTFTGTISNSNFSKEYTVDLTEGEAIVVVAEASGGDLDTYLFLYDPTGALVGENDDRGDGSFDSQIAHLAEMTGTYTIEITRYEFANGDTRGNYRVQVSIGDAELLQYAMELTRPSLSGDAQSVATEHFRIHYTFEGSDRVTQDFVDAVAQAAEFFYDIQVNQLGFSPILQDNGAGGDTLYDIYLLDLIGSGEGALGYASQEDFVGDHPATPEVETSAATSYVAIENDFDDTSGEGAGAEGLMRATLTHELNHAMQFGYDISDPHAWFYEATAVWIETATAGDEQDGTGYVAYAYEYPELCFGTINDPDPGALQYGEWTFLQMLVDLYGQDVVQQYWTQIAQYDGWESLEQLLSDVGTMTIPDVVAAYRMKNLARDYALAPLFNATVWLENTIDDSGSWSPTGSGIQELGANYFRVTAPKGVYHFALDDADIGLELWGIGLLGEKMEAYALGSGADVDTSAYDDFYVMVFNTNYDDDMDDCVYEQYAINVGSAKGVPSSGVFYVFPATHFETLG
jgi:hypothetical protein